jgi:hypothetical protein
MPPPTSRGAEPRTTLCQQAGLLWAPPRHAAMPAVDPGAVLAITKVSQGSCRPKSERGLNQW